MCSMNASKMHNRCMQILIVLISLDQRTYGVAYIAISVQLVVNSEIISVALRNLSEDSQPMVSGVLK